MQIWKRDTLSAWLRYDSEFSAVKTDARDQVVTSICVNRRNPSLRRRYRVLSSPVAHSVALGPPPLARLDY